MATIISHSIAALAVGKVFSWEPKMAIEVSPIGLEPFLSGRGLQVIVSEIMWIWIPSALLATLTEVYRRVRRS